MKITILGSGSAYGTPMIFNTWGKADANIFENKRTRASLLIEEQGHSLLVDAGPDLRNQINDNNIKNIDSVWITHGHYDHIAGIPELPRATKLLGHGIDIYSSKETSDELKQCYGYLYKDKAEAEPDSKSLRWHILPDNGEVKIGTLKFATVLFPHHHIHSSALRYENFAYITDWQAIPEDIGCFLNDLDLLIVECNNGTEPEANGHSDIFKIRELRERYNPKEIILSHLSTRIDYQNFQKEIPENCKLAYDGMQIYL